MELSIWRPRRSPCLPWLWAYRHFGRKFGASLEAGECFTRDVTAFSSVFNPPMGIDEAENAVGSGGMATQKLAARP
ncbi:MAG: hypothetical protein KDD02_19655 [Phaeodactylibacter sp.]|nr:hypothetical protein [Phaeodactylibacter sp.]MCB9304471.1 hypothetical protein [Lewinellaceae bacterium]HQU58090.1 hypothetical protein [Saprospiraceae bacterium]